ncbi:purine-cytosine permease family protein [Saccharopolyspora tripterygii]
MKPEKHSIDFVPLSERYGSPKRLFTLWFSANMQVTAMIVGTLGVVGGLGLFWVILGLVVGNLSGAVFMAAHSTQGPHLGVPQMIQSRAQFGVYGAALPLLAVVVAYVLFFAANAVMMRDAVEHILPVGHSAALIVFGLVTFVVAFFGYELIHRIGTLMSWISAALLGTIAVIVLFTDQVDAGVTAPPTMDYTFATFLLVATQAFSWSLGFGPFVADYSRYLPADVRSRDTFTYSYLGQAMGSTLVMIVGALAATAAIDITASPALGVAGLFGRFAYPAMCLILIGVMLFNVLCLYSGYMSTVAIFSGFRNMDVIPPRTKFMVMGAIALLGTGIAVATQDDFFTFFGDILVAQVYVLVPWTAINLVDFYFIRRGDYVIEDVFDPNGRYGRYNIPTIAIFAVSIVAQVPFMNLSIYQGPVAEVLGADISCLVGLVLAVLLYSIILRPSRQTADVR